MRILKPKEVISWPTFYQRPFTSAQGGQVLCPFNKPKAGHDSTQPGRTGDTSAFTVQHKVTVEIKSHQIGFSFCQLAIRQEEVNKFSFFKIINGVSEINNYGLVRWRQSYSTSRGRRALSHQLESYYFTSKLRHLCHHMFASFKCGQWHTII